MTPKFSLDLRFKMLQKLVIRKDGITPVVHQFLNEQHPRLAVVSDHSDRHWVRLLAV